MIKQGAKALVLKLLDLTVGAGLSAAIHGGGRRRTGLLAPLTRERFIGMVPRDGEVLEIGPFDRPKLQGANVRYFDVLEQKGLRERARSIEGFNPETCPFIDYVSASGDLSVVGRRFTAVFSSHAIEHQPDLIKHLRDVHDLLEEGGCYYVIVPDKRFCFDHHLPETQTADVEAALGQTRHSRAAIEDHYLRKAHNRALLHWIGIHGRPNGHPEEAKRALAQAAQGEYVDVHAWTFTPASFRKCVQDLFHAGKIGLEPVTTFDTRFGHLEFMAVLRKA